MITLTSCKIGPHYVCVFESNKQLYFRAVKGNIFDSSFSNYTINENVFITSLESTECWVKDKNKTKASFCFEVYSKDEKYDYKIIDISLMIDGEKHNINEFITDYYPYDTEKYTSFTESPVVPQYYWSVYHLGYITFPTPKDKKVDFVVTVLDNESNKHTFVYKYSIKMIFDLFVSLS